MKASVLEEYVHYVMWWCEALGLPKPLWMLATVWIPFALWK